MNVTRRVTNAQKSNSKIEKPRLRDFGVSTQARTVEPTDRSDTGGIEQEILGGEASSDAREMEADANQATDAVDEFAGMPEQTIREILAGREALRINQEKLRSIVEE